MLEEAAYGGLLGGKLPRVPNAKLPRELALEAAREAARARVLTINEARLVRAKASPLKRISIEWAGMEGYRFTHRSAYIAVAGDELTFRVRFSYRGTIPEIVRCTASAGDKSRTEAVFFAPRSTYEMAVKVPVGEPGYLRCSATTKPRPKAPLRYAIDYIRLANSASQSYPVGLLDPRPKPVSEYPVSGVDNAELMSPYSWSVGYSVYPTDVPPGLYIGGLSVEYRSGFVEYAGRYYRDPATNNTVRVRARVTNTTGYTLTLRNYGLVVSVLYEDNIHVSQAVVDVSFPERTLAHGESHSYYLDVNIPTWAYGRVAIAHAIAFYRGNTLFWVGGPFYRIEVGRLRLP